MNSNKKYTAAIATLGCKVNQYESEAICEELERNGIEIKSASDICDAYVINTCTVTAESDRKGRQLIRRLIAKNPRAVIVVTGCMAQSAPDEVAKIEGVDVIIGNCNKLEAARAVIETLEKGLKNETPKIYTSELENAEFEKMRITKFERTRAYVKIEDGCENRCSYCIIPSARGKVRSKDPSELLLEVEALVRGGCREVVLTGIETASYGRDLGNIDLASILCKVDKIDGIGRVRLGSLDPSLIKRPFVEKIAQLSSLAPHFHLSLQSGSDRVLALMRRKYNSKMALDAINLLKEKMPGVKFTTDVIVGFPGETEEDFEATLDFVKQARFLMVHIFPYSKRKGTPAAEMDGQISKEEKSRRLKILSEECNKIRAEILQSEVDEVKNSSEPIYRTVLFESFEDGYAIGHTEDFLEVWAKSEYALHAEFKKVLFSDTDGNRIFAKICE